MSTFSETTVKHPRRAPNCFIVTNEIKDLTTRMNTSADNKIRVMFMYFFNGTELVRSGRENWRAAGVDAVSKTLILLHLRSQNSPAIHLMTLCQLVVRRVSLPIDNVLPQFFQALPLNSTLIYSRDCNQFHNPTIS